MPRFFAERCSVVTASGAAASGFSLATAGYTTTYGYMAGTRDFAASNAAGVCTLYVRRD